jgi:antitoxin VapB
LPAEFRGDGDEVYAIREDVTGDVVLSDRPGRKGWRDFFETMRAIDVPGEFMDDRPVNLPPQERDNFVSRGSGYSTQRPKRICENRSLTVAARNRVGCVSRGGFRRLVGSQELRVGFSGDEIRVAENFLVQRNGGVDAFDHEHFQGPAHAGDGFGAVGAVGD